MFPPRRKISGLKQTPNIPPLSKTADRATKRTADWRLGALSKNGYCFSEMLQHPTLNFGNNVAEERLRSPAELLMTVCRYFHTTLNYKILSNRVVIVGTVERQTKMVSVSFVVNVQTQTGPSL